MIIFLIITMLFAIAFVAKRRFGILALALVAGATLGTLWVGDITPIVARAGFVLVRPPLESIVTSVVTLLPALLMFASGPVYHRMSQRVMGALLFSLLAVVLLLQPIGLALVIEGPGKEVYDFLVANRSIIITTCIVIAVFDIILTKTPKIPSKH